MRSILLLLFLSSSHLLFSQKFVEVPHYNAFVGVGEGMMVYEDFNSDSIPDLLIAGRRSKLFFNNGLGQFQEGDDLPFERVNYSHMAVADLNGDFNLDVIYTGQVKKGVIITKIYLGDGLGHFSEKEDTNFIVAEYGSVTIADFNGDNFPDVILTGRIGTDREARLYINDGNAHFTEVEDTPFEGVDFASVVAKDIDGDGDLDVFISGDTGLVFTSKGPIDQYARTSKLYINDGQGHFKLKENTPFIGIYNGVVSIEDFNGDGYLDVLMVGEKYIKKRVARIYLNDGKGDFIEKTDISIQAIDEGSMDVGDINGDGHLDIIISGKPNWKTATTELYLNDGTANFTLAEETAFIGLSKGSTLLRDVDDDGHLDAIITGGMFRQYMKLYINNGKGQFKESKETPFYGTSYGTGSCADLNNDGYQDVIINGYDNSYKETSRIYFGKEGQDFEPQEDSVFVAVNDNSVAIQDINNDNYPDVFMIGSDRKGIPVAKLYVNDSTGLFREDTTIQFLGVTRGDAVIGNLNGDSAPDILYSGYDSTRLKVSNLYFNDGEGRFIKAKSTPLDSVGYGTIDIEDLDGDGSLDVFITGDGNGFKKKANLFFNDGRGHFTMAKDLPFVKVKNSAVAIADINHDDRPDILLCGNYGINKLVTKLYLNKGSGVFEEKANAPFEGVHYGAVAMADLNGDTHMDVVLTGKNKDKQHITKLYTNDGTGNFTEVKDVPFEGVNHSSIAIADINNDDRPDILITGSNGKIKTSRLYINQEE